MGETHTHLNALINYSRSSSTTVPIMHRGAEERSPELTIMCVLLLRITSFLSFHHANVIVSLHSLVLLLPIVVLNSTFLPHSFAHSDRPHLHSWTVPLWRRRRVAEHFAPNCENIIILHTFIFPQTAYSDVPLMIVITQRAHNLYLPLHSGLCVPYCCQFPACKWECSEATSIRTNGHHWCAAGIALIPHFN